MTLFFNYDSVNYTSTPDLIYEFFPVMAKNLGLDLPLPKLITLEALEKCGLKHKDIDCLLEWKVLDGPSFSDLDHNINHNK